VTANDRQPRDIVTIGASAGGIEALLALFAKLPPDLAATLAVVVHRAPYYMSILDRILDRKSTLPVKEPADGDPVERSRIYLAPRDQHLTLDGDRFRLDRGPQQHRMRPAVDPLFLSAAKSYGARVVGMLLSGSGADGVRGLIAIKAAGGVSLVQDPAEARNPSMPATAIAEDDVDAILPIEGLSSALVSLAMGEGLGHVAAATRRGNGRGRP
jgi:two-component system chemotaxis response regulator CheB